MIEQTAKVGSVSTFRDGKNDNPRKMNSIVQSDYIGILYHKSAPGVDHDRSLLRYKIKNKFIFIILSVL